MANYDLDLMYEFRAGNLTNREALHAYADQAVREIKMAAGWDSEVQVHIEPEAKDKRLFAVSMSVFGLGESIVIRKQGRHALALLRKVRKAVLRQIHRLHEKRIAGRKRKTLREQVAS